MHILFFIFTLFSIFSSLYSKTRSSNSFIEKGNYIQPSDGSGTQNSSFWDFGTQFEISHNFCPKILPYLQGYSKVEYENMTKFGVV